MCRHYIHHFLVGPKPFRIDNNFVAICQCLSTCMQKCLLNTAPLNECQRLYETGIYEVVASFTLYSFNISWDERHRCSGVNFHWFPELVLKPFMMSSCCQIPLDQWWITITCMTNYRIISFPAKFWNNLFSTDNQQHLWTIVNILNPFKRFMQFVA